MKVVVDTNVLISGLLFSGTPARIFKVWRRRRIRFVLTPEILEEYVRVCNVLQEQFPEVELSAILQAIAAKSDLIQAPALAEAVCDDPDDDKFLACAVAGKTKIVVSGDRHLLKVSGYRGIRVLTPREFVNEFIDRE